MKDLVIIGAGGCGREVAWLVDDINKINNQWNLLGFIDENEDNHGKILNGYKILGGFDYLINKDNIYYVCAIGNSKIKKKIVEEKCSKYNIKAATLIHPTVLISDKNNEIGEGCIICANSIITINVKLGKHVFVNFNCTITHDVVIEEFVTIYPNVNISGNCNISKCVEIGTGTKIIQGKSIGENTILGAGSIVVNDLQSDVTAVGVPARVIKYHNKSTCENIKSKKGKKVLYVTTVSRTVNAFLVPHIEMLLEEGYKVDIASCIDKEIDNRLIRRGVKIFDIPFSRNPLNPANIKAFKELIKIQKEENYDIVHVHTPVASIYGRLLKLKFKNLKTIYTAHGYHFFKGGSKLGWFIYYPIEKLMAKLTDVIININSEDYKITKKRLKPKKSYFVKGVGIDLTTYKSLSEVEKLRKREELGLSQEDYIVIMIAELNENKNQIQLIKAMELLKDDYPNIKAICIGEGNRIEELKDEVEKRGLKGRVKFLGFRTDVNDLINISDMGVLLSYREGLPRNIMELMANGKKVLATNIRGCRDLVSNNIVGDLVSVNDHIATSKVIIRNYLHKISKIKADDNVEKMAITKEIAPYDINNINKELKSIYNSL